MRKFLGYILTPIHLLGFVGTLLVFHPLQYFVFYVFGSMAHRRLVYIMNGILSSTLMLLGHRIKFFNEYDLPTDRPLIIVANHNSLHDIPTMYFGMRKYHPVFVSKLSLSKSIPSVSFNLRKSGAALIDRGDRLQALKEILRLGTLIHEKKFSAVIFPEGTRRGSNLKPFKPGGVGALLKKAPDALIVPVAIHGTQQINFEKKFPMNTFLKLSWKVQQPIEPMDKDVQDLMNEARSSIADALADFQN